MHDMRFFLLFISIAAFAQESTKFLPKRLAEGHPDFGGVWRKAKGTELIEYDCIEGERDEVHYPGSAAAKP